MITDRIGLHSVLLLLHIIIVVIVIAIVIIIIIIIFIACPVKRSWGKPQQIHSGKSI